MSHRNIALGLFAALTLTGTSSANRFIRAVQASFRSGKTAGGAGIEAVRRTVSRNEVVSQADLRVAVSEAASRRTFVFEKEVTTGYRIPESAQGVADLPASIRQHLAKVDDTGYSDAFIRSRRGDHVVLQFKQNGAPDFYISKGSADIYDVVGSQAGGADAKLRAVRSVVDEAIPVEVLQKPGVVEMVPAADVGFPTARNTRIESPWEAGETQTAGLNAWIVKNGDESYVVNSNELTRMPIGYRFLDSTNPVPPAPALETFKRVNRASTGLFGI